MRDLIMKLNRASNSAALSVSLPVALVDEIISTLRHMDGIVLEMARNYVPPDQDIRSGVYLTATERAIYALLYSHPGQAIHMDDLVAASGTSTPESLWVHVHRLRRKIDPQRVEIRTIKEFGYELTKYDLTHPHP